MKEIGSFLENEENPVMSPEELLDEFVADAAGSGDRVLARTRDRVVLAIGQPVHHLRHLVASICCFLWVPAWAWIWLTGGERILTVTIDADGELNEQLSPMSLGRKAFLAALLVGWLAVVAALVLILMWLNR